MLCPRPREQKTQTQKSMSMAFENLLKEFDVTNPSEISEENKSAFLEKLFSNFKVGICC